MNLTLKFDQASYRHAMNRFVTELKADGVLLLKEEMRLLLRDIVKFTPPQKGHAQGRNAIKGDLFGGKRKSGARYSSIGLFQRIGTSTLAVPERAQKSGAATYAVNLGWEGGKRVRIYKKFWQPEASVSQMRAFHKRFQDPRTGRVGFVSQSVIGRHRVQDQMWVSNAAASAYFKLLADRVGLARAGWGSAAAAVGLRLPQWVSKHKGANLGSYSPPSPNNLQIVATNTSTKIPNYFERHVYPAMRSRVRSIQSELTRLLSGGKSRRGSLAGTAAGQAD
jgi:hypothetical protein